MRTAGVFALFAMIYVPAPSQQHPFSRAHYRFIFSQDETGIAFFQLLVNVAFAALLGAILVTIVPKIVTGLRRLPKRVWLGIGGLALIAVFIAAGVAWSNFTEPAQRDERYATELLRARHDVFDQAVAESYFLNAARNWRLALRFDEATRVENRIKELRWKNDPIVISAPQGPALKTEQSQTSSPAGPTVTPEDQSVKSTSSYATARDFATYAMKLREQELLNAGPQVLAPKDSQPAGNVTRGKRTF
jgi:hypothetical protein